MDSSAQHIRDYKLAIEFKYLMAHAPAGVYLMPEFEDIRQLHGVIFVRRGLYRDGMFRFVMRLPPMYNTSDTHPQIFFDPPLFSPLVDPLSGALDLCAEEALLVWQPEKHFLVTAVTFLKRVFYMKGFDQFERIANPEAQHMFNTDKQGFLKRVEAEVQASQKAVFRRDSLGPACTLLFSELQPAHDDVLRRALQQDALAGKSDAQLSAQEWVMRDEPDRDGDRHREQPAEAGADLESEAVS